MADEKRLIDANKLQHLLLPIATGLEHEYGSLGGAVSGVMKHIDSAPTVDAVEVVRCKDCKYRKEPENRLCNPYCTKHLSMQAKDDDFCSCGERKTDG